MQSMEALIARAVCQPGLWFKYVTILLKSDGLMPRKASISIRLAPADSEVLSRQKDSVWRRHALRAEIVLRAAKGETNYMIAKELRVSRNTVKKWRYRFASEGVIGLDSRPIPGRPKAQTNLGVFRPKALAIAQRDLQEVQ